MNHYHYTFYKMFLGQHFYTPIKTIKECIPFLNKFVDNMNKREILHKS